MERDIIMAKFASRMSNMESSARIIRNLFGAMNDPDIISFGGGAIAAECLPIDQIREICNIILKKETRGIETLAYGPVMGVTDLREAVVRDLLKPKGVKANPETVMILTGGLEAMNLMCQIFIEPDDIILVESPTFVHSVEIFEMFQAKCIAVEMDDNGLLIDDLEKKIIEFKPKMIYTIPTFQNPSGRTLSRERRQKVAKLASEHDVIVLEDDPYRDIRYSGEDLPPIKTFDKTGHTVLAGSLSKIFTPGLRLGYIHGDDEIISMLMNAKSATNSHTSMLPQIICAEFFKQGYFPAQLKLICDVHRKRRDAMIESIDEFFPDGTKRTYPDGGLFTWVELPGSLNTTHLLTESMSNLKVRVAYIAGEGFFVEGNGKGNNSMRISFGAVPPEKIRIGAERLGKLISSRLSQRYPEL
ncbi:MAG: PLP-dependent aminotransferase family protein [Sedimentisphaerales bacterium]